jgi:hypothetical protein
MTADSGIISFPKQDEYYSIVLPLIRRLVNIAVDTASMYISYTLYEQYYFVQ